MCINFPYFESASLNASTLAVCYSLFSLSTPLCSPVAKESQLIFCIEENNSNYLRWQTYSFVFVILVGIRKFVFLSEINSFAWKILRFSLVRYAHFELSKVESLNWSQFVPISVTYTWPFFVNYWSIANLSNLFPTVACWADVCVLKSKSNWLTSK